jgi:hypothetical protein
MLFQNIITNSSSSSSLQSFVNKCGCYLSKQIDVFECALSNSTTSSHRLSSMNQKSKQAKICMFCVLQSNNLLEQMLPQNIMKQFFFATKFHEQMQLLLSRNELFLFLNAHGAIFSCAFSSVEHPKPTNRSSSSSLFIHPELRSLACCVLLYILVC